MTKNLDDFENTLWDWITDEQLKSPKSFDEYNKDTIETLQAVIQSLNNIINDLTYEKDEYGYYKKDSN